MTETVTYADLARILETHLNEQLRIYKASLNVVEDLLTILEMRKINGFTKEGEK